MTLRPISRIAPLAMAAALCALSGAARSAPAVALTAVDNLGVASSVGATNRMNGSANGGDFFYSGSAGANTSFFHTYGFPSGLSYFGARVSATGTFFGRTTALYTNSYVNSSATSQQVTFNFNVDYGEIGLSGAGTGYADLLLQVMFGSTVVARDHGRVETTSGGTTCNTNVGGGDVGALGSGYLACAGGSGTAANATGTSGAYAISQLLAVGETLNVAYTIEAEVSGTLDASGATTECSSGPRPNGQPGTQTAAVAIGGQPGYSGCQAFNAIARSGDPAGFTAFNPGLFNITAAPAAVDVPEPTSLALAALAMVGLAAASRRRYAAA